MIKIKVEKLKKIVQEILRGYDILPADAEEIANHLIKANIMGMDSHGVMRLPYYLEEVKKGNINKLPTFKTKRIGDFTIIDGDKGFGQIVARYATEHAITSAKGKGISVVGAKNLSHVGMLGYYTLMIAEHGMIGFATTNTDPAIAPVGSRKAALGTNPISIAIPTGNSPILLDMALSVASGGKILFAKKHNEKIPIGWALDAEGNPTQDPNEALNGTLLPIGMHKGYGLALIIDIICGILIGGGYGLELQPGWASQGGLMVMAIDIELIKPLKEFYIEIQRYLEIIKGLPTAPGYNRIMIPGEDLFEKIENNKEDIQLDDETYKLLLQLAEEGGIKISDE
ncbi:Ldh family oxidoreductase [Thermoanaerobacter wiegelii]|uniref:Malate/L-lactate dehydrogenase n=1 Tax=Thermoanaerobacter wiegelii Rt8.B1 TaxID=697303 RepID=G2MUW0_9THEO|nr:Ldh family oxidoreductase [Thermoanaerobacter wiegelii]AEM77861.1 Malate/L-lactate dehydrogenase [Thermoanaerobacter wiegelii Rt8.B1]